MVYVSRTHLHRLWLIAPWIGDENASGRTGRRRAREQAATQAGSALDQIGMTAPSPSTPTSPAPQSSPGDDSIFERARYEGRYEVDATAQDAIADKLREVAEEVVRHIVSAPGAENISIVLEVSAENSDGFSEAVARTVRENSRVLGFCNSNFEDFKW